MSLRIVRLARCMSNQLCCGDAVNRKISQEEVFSIKQKDQFAEPRNEQGNYIMTLDGNLATGSYLYLLKRDHQIFHPLSSMDKQLGQILSVRMQTNIGSMLEYFIGL